MVGGRGQSDPLSRRRGAALGPVHRRESFPSAAGPQIIGASDV